MGSSPSSLCIGSFWRQGVGMRPGTAGRGGCLRPGGSCTMHRIAAASGTSIGIPPNLMGMASGTIGGGRTSGKGMRVAWHLAGSQRHRRRTAGFLHGIKVTVTGIDPHWDPSAAPGHPGSSKICGRIGRLHAQVNAAHRIDSSHKALDVIF